MSPISLEHLLIDPFHHLRFESERPQASKSGAGVDTCRPALNIWQTEEGLTVQLELPGMKKEDVDVHINDTFLVISGQLAAYKCVDDKCSCVHEERHCGHFTRKVLIPRGLKPDEIKAEMNDGLLKLKIPKRSATEEETFKIEIN